MYKGSEYNFFRFLSHKILGLSNVNWISLATKEYKYWNIKSTNFKYNDPPTKYRVKRVLGKVTSNGMSIQLNYHDLGSSYT